MSGRITTHVLDAATGGPAVGVALTLTRLPEREEVGAWRTNGDGRTDAPLLEGEALLEGEYELAFEVGQWRDGPGFYDVVPIRFVVANALAHHHVPLILSPFGYSTYRGT